MAQAERARARRARSSLVMDSSFAAIRVDAQAYFHQ